MPRFLESAHERARLTVVPQRAPRVARVPFVILMLLLLGAGLVGLLVLNTSLQQGAFQAAALQTRQVALSTRQHDLELEVSTLQNPQRLARVAQRLGMVPNTNPVFIDAANGRVLGSPAPAIPGTGPELRPPPPPRPVRHHHRGTIATRQAPDPTRRRTTRMGSSNQVTMATRAPTRHTSHSTPNRHGSRSPHRHRGRRIAGDPAQERLRLETCGLGSPPSTRCGVQALGRTPVGQHQ
jgi:cell division protein FtsL